MANILDKWGKPIVLPPDPYNPKAGDLGHTQAHADLWRIVHDLIERVSHLEGEYGN